MKAADRLSQTLGANITESMGVKRTGGEQASNPFPTGSGGPRWTSVGEVPGRGPHQGRLRHRA